MNDFNFQFAMYNPVTDTVEVNTGTGTALFIHCKNFNSTVMIKQKEIDFTYGVQLLIIW